MNPIDVNNLFLWTDFFGLTISALFLVLGFYLGYRRGVKAGKDEMKTFLLGESIAYLMERDRDR